MHDLIRQLREPNKTKIVMLVADGLGGLPIEPGGKTELEAARTPNLDRLAAEGTVGLSIPVAPGIMPGSGPPRRPHRRDHIRSRPEHGR
jgi:2,3-bisphosphoglycerate-independent phosphoglycerate mutase